MQVTTRPKRVQLRRFTFTLNNWTDEEYKQVTEFNCKWMIVGKEKGKEGTPHLQGAVVIGRAMDFATLKRNPGFRRAHIEPMKGSVDQNINYCSKEDSNPFTKGDPPAPGKRNDIHRVLEELKDGRLLDEIVKEMDVELVAPIVRYQKGFTFVETVLTSERETPPIVIWVYGSTGTGKTRGVRELSKSLGCPRPWMSSGELRWFTGYSNQSCCILDDLRTRHAKFEFLLRLLDRYPVDVEIKYGSKHWRPKFIFITAPKSPREMWSLRTEEDVLQLERRITARVNADKYKSYEELLYKLRAVVRKGLQVPSIVPRKVVDLTEDLLPEDRNGEITEALYDHAACAFV